MVAVATLVGSASLAAQTTSAAQPPRIITSGEGQTHVTPDRATVFVGVETRAKTAAAAGSENASLQTAIINRLKALGIAADQLMTQNYSVSPQIRYDTNGGEPTVLGYVVSNTVTVQLKRVDMVGTVIDAALASGANRIGGVQFSSSNVAEARRTAMAEAVANAKADAEVLAKAAGGSLGSLVELTANAPPFRPGFQVMDAAMRSAAPTPIQPGEQEITANVSATWEFIPGK
jgi:uncharacterized protein YggE